MAFIDRINDMRALDEEYNKKASSFVVVYGRRRLGKTTLLKEFLKNKKGFYFLATEETEAENVENFKMLVADMVDSDLLKESRVDRWDIVFKELSRNINAKEKIVVVMDEFQNLARVNSAFPSVFMKIWDEVLKDKNIMLIICGSLINMMTSIALNYDSPLYGRRTSQIKMKQVEFRYYKDFYSRKNDEELVDYYAVTGGVPKYIEIFNDTKDIFEAIRKNILSKNAFLYAEPEFLLQKEVIEIGSYFSILKMISFGNRKVSDIAKRLNIKQTSLSQYLKNLIDLDIVERRVPITEENFEKSKKGLYYIKDNFLNFWFRYVLPYKNFLEIDNVDYVLDKIKKDFYAKYVPFIYEEICREKVKYLNINNIMYDKVGAYWDKDNEIDIVAYNSESYDILFGECKYSKNKKGMEVLEMLRQKSQVVNWHNESRNEKFIIFSKSGFANDLINYAKKNKNVILEK